MQLSSQLQAPPQSEMTRPGCVQQQESCDGLGTSSRGAAVADSCSSTCAANARHPATRTAAKRETITRKLAAVDDAIVLAGGTTVASTSCPLSRAESIHLQLLRTTPILRAAMRLPAGRSSTETATAVPSQRPLGIRMSPAVGPTLSPTDHKSAVHACISAS